MSQIQDKNRRMALAVVAVVVGMIGLSFASVPLYRLFCQMTGYDGTTQEGGQLPDTPLEREITVSFDAQVDKSLPWSFKPEARKITVKIGQKGLVSFVATNEGYNHTAGTALYNVTPDKAGKYFHKIQCFCFDKQDLPAGKTAHFPVVFFVDPSIADDPLLDDVTDITLSYTFFAAESDALDDALSNYGQKK